MHLFTRFEINFKLQFPKINVKIYSSMTTSAAPPAERYQETTVEVAGFILGLNVPDNWSAVQFIDQ